MRLTEEQAAQIRKRELLDFHLTFSTDHGRRVLDVLKRDLFDKLSFFAPVEGGERILLDDRSALARDAQRLGYERIMDYLRAYEMET